MLVYICMWCCYYYCHRSAHTRNIGRNCESVSVCANAIAQLNTCKFSDSQGASSINWTNKSIRTHWAFFSINILLLFGVFGRAALERENLQNEIACTNALWVEFLFILFRWTNIAPDDRNGEWNEMRNCFREFRWFAWWCLLQWPKDQRKCCALILRKTSDKRFVLLECFECLPQLQWKSISFPMHGAS